MTLQHQRCISSKRSFLQGCETLQTQCYPERSISPGAKLVCYINQDTTPSVEVTYDGKMYTIKLDSEYFEQKGEFKLENPKYFVNCIFNTYLHANKISINGIVFDLYEFYDPKYGDISSDSSKFYEFRKLKEKSDLNPYELEELKKMKKMYPKLKKIGFVSPKQYKILKDAHHARNSCEKLLSSNPHDRDYCEFCQFRNINHPCVPCVPLYQPYHTTRTGTITITFGDVAENHVGMQKIGIKSSEGFSYKDLCRYKKLFKKCTTELICLNDYLPTEEDIETAYLLIIRNGVDRILQKISIEKEALFDELVSLPWDKKAKMKGRIVNKKARYNLCFSTEDQEPEYENGKGRIVSWKNTPLLNLVKAEVDPEDTLTAEGNYYYDTKTCYIGAHGDTERKKVLALRLGEPLDITFQWYYQREPIGKKFTTILNNGDIYIMSSKTVGTDWRTMEYTLRHSVNR